MRILNTKLDMFYIRLDHAGVEQGTLQYTWTTLRSWESRATDATKTFTGESNLASTSI